jgi:hypothetical protein
MRYRCASWSKTEKLRRAPPRKLVRFGKPCPLEGKSALPVVRFAETAEFSHVKNRKHIFTRKKEHVRNAQSQNDNAAGEFAS